LSAVNKHDGNGCEVKEPWEMDLAEWEAAAARGQIVQDHGPERDLQAVLSGEKPATDLEIRTSHPLAEMYESGDLEERVDRAMVYRDERDLRLCRAAQLPPHPDQRSHCQGDRP